MNFFNDEITITITRKKLTAERLKESEEIIIKTRFIRWIYLHYLKYICAQ